MSIDELAAKYANMSDMLIDLDAEAEGKFLILVQLNLAVFQ